MREGTWRVRRRPGTEKGPWAGLLQDTATAVGSPGWAAGPLGRLRLPTAAPPARLARAVPVCTGVGSQCGDPVCQGAGAGSWPWRLAVVRVVGPVAQGPGRPSSKGRKKSRAVLWVLEELEVGGRTEDRVPVSVQRLRFGSRLRRPSVSRQRGRAELAEQQQCWCFF